MTTSQYITERTNGALSLVDDSPSSKTVLDTNEYFALIFCTQYHSYLRNYVQYKGFSNYNEDLDLYDIDLNKNGFDTGYYISKDYYNLKKVFKQVREDRGRIIVVSVNDSSKVELIDEDITSLSAPVATAATNITTTSFSANWNVVSGALGYKLYVYTDSTLQTVVTGYNGLDVGNVLTDSVTGLTDGTNYYYIIKAYNNQQTSENSNTITTTTDVENVVDADGNIYTYVIIGTQQWMIENFKSTKYRDGTAIPNLTVDGDWIADITGAYCWYNNDIANKTDYGALYNHYAVGNVHELAPTGWRVPSSADMLVLQTYLGGIIIAGGKLKEMGLTHWTTPNTDATNESGFTAVGGGVRLSGGSFTLINMYGSFWATDGGGSPYNFNVEYDDGEMNIGQAVGHPEFGLNIRMMRDV